MGKYARRLKKALGRPLELTKVQKLSGPQSAHGCEACRGEENRRELIASLLLKAQLGSWICKCPQCSADWKVTLYIEGPREEVMARFVPMHTGSSLN